MRLHVKDVMTVDPVTVGPDAGYKEVVGQLVDHDVGGLPVVDDVGKLLGIVTESDLLTKPARGDDGGGRRSVIKALLGRRRPAWVSKASGLTATEIMSDDLITATPGETVDAVARRLVKHRIGRVPVVDEDGLLVGIVSQRDLLRPFHRPDGDIVTELEAVLTNPMTFEHAHQVKISVSAGIVTMTGTVSYPRDLTTLRSSVRNVPGVVDIRDEVTALLPEPRPERAPMPPEMFGRGI